MACIALGHRRARNYILYICGTQKAADDHVGNIASALEQSTLREIDPELCDRKIGRYGMSKGWTISRLRTQSGLTVDGVGLDSMRRGSKLDNRRPDFLLFDDVDSDHDTDFLVQKKILTITRKILPSGSPNVAVLFVQNLVHANSVAARLEDGRAEFLSNRIVSGPHPALNHFTYKQKGKATIITSGEPTWEGLSVERCQGIINDVGLTSFLAEYQHDRTAQQGAFFGDVWSQSIHMVAPFTIPASWYIDRAFDWGSSHPFSVVWFAESDGCEAPNGRTYPAGTIFVIAEWYGWNGNPNEGIKLLAADIARGIVEREAAMEHHGRIHAGPADNQIFQGTNGMCIADDMADAGVTWTYSDKRPGSRVNGARVMHEHLERSTTYPMEGPGLFAFTTCTQFARTIPILPKDLKKPDDVNTASEDHIFDAVRYRLMDASTDCIQLKVSA